MSVSIDEAIKRLERAKARLEDPSEFYALHKADWEQLAKTTVTQLLLTHKPVNADQQHWAETVGHIVERIVASLFDDAESTGLILFASTDSTQPTGNYPAVVDFETIVKWIESGRSGDPTGKHIKPEESVQSDRQIAWRVFHALRNKSGDNIDRLRKAIEEYAMSGGLAEIDGFLSAIEPAWFEVFSVRAPQDWRRWVDAVTAEIR